MSRRFTFAFSTAGKAVLTPLGVRPDNSWVEIDEDLLRARFGRFGVSTPTTNITGTSVQGPHNPLKAIGLRWSFADHGATFGSNAERTVCVEFAEPVKVGMDPFGLLRHPNLSLAVAEPHELVAAIREAAGL